MIQKYKIALEQPKHIYFIGIGGISMSGLAQILLNAGFHISGSDAKRSEQTQKLESLGAKIYYGQSYENISEDIDAIIYTAAIRENNPEYRAGLDKQIPMITRATLLGQLMENYQYSIAISGTHGKTTTTSMLSYILLEAEMNPTISVGGNVSAIGGNIHIGENKVFLTEACEYTNSFLELHPTIGVILNIEADHLDFFKDLEDIRHSFGLFVKQIASHGTLIINNTIPNFKECIGDFQGRVLTIGFENADIMAKNIEYLKDGRLSFELYLRKDLGKIESLESRENLKENSISWGRVDISVPGKHNVENALAAIGTMIALDYKEEAIIKRGLHKYQGVGRRFERKGMLAGKIAIIDDYAHHPQEIEATLKTVKELSLYRQIWCVFQPHTYTRTLAFLKEFAKALSISDYIIITDIFAARETDDLGVHSLDIVKQINQEFPDKAIYIRSFEGIENYLLEHLEEGDICITMGAGDIYKVADRILGNI